MYCQATTKSGKQCKNKAKDGGFCSLHAKASQNDATPPEEEAVPEAPDTVDHNVTDAQERRKSLGKSPMAVGLGVLGVPIGVIFGLAYVTKQNTSPFSIYEWIAGMAVLGAVIGLGIDSIMKAIFGEDRYIQFMDVLKMSAGMVVVLVVGLTGGTIGIYLGDRWYTSIPLAVVGFVVGVFVGLGVIT